ncbi:MAG: DUF2203 domain-containing protein [Thermosynechococcaceae cyanobacterium]
MSDSEHPSTHPSDDELDIEQSLSEAEATLNTLKIRYQNIQRAQEQQPLLEQKLQELQEQAHQLRKESDSQQERLALRKEIDNVQEQLEIIELELESRLFKLLTWRDKKEWFWQFLRFSGIGFGAALLIGHLTR